MNKGEIQDDKIKLASFSSKKIWQWQKWCETMRLEVSFLAENILNLVLVKLHLRHDMHNRNRHLRDLGFWWADWEHFSLGVRWWGLLDTCKWCVLQGRGDKSRKTGQAVHVAQSVNNLPAMQESTCNAGDLGSIPGVEKCPGEGYGNPL